MKKSLLRELAGKPAFARGEKYYAEGRVRNLVKSAGGNISAEVKGTRTYRVYLREAGDDLEFSCDCPVGMRDEFCKHGVAVGLAAMDESHESPKSDLRAWLESLDAPRLVDLLETLAAKYDGVADYLNLQASSARMDVVALKKQIRGLIGGRRFIGYHDMYEYAQGLWEITHMLEGLLAANRAETGAELALYALDRLKTAYHNMDDSSGMAGEEMERWEELLGKAWRMHPPADAKAQGKLARELFRRNLDSDWGEFADAAGRYADVLSEAGAAEFRALARKKWETLPVLGPGQKDEGGNHRFRLTRMMESFAREDGDFAALIAVLSRDLSRPGCYKRIVEVCREFKRRGEALAWAKKAVAAFPKEAMLEEELIEELLHAGEARQAVALAWAMFEREPSTRTWELLRRCAGRDGSWEHEWKPWALDHARDHVAREKTAPSSRLFRYSLGNSLLVEIHLLEDELEEAWNAARGGCTHPLMRRLGERLASEYPERAAKAWMQLVEPVINRKKNDAYDEAVKMMRRIGEWMQKAGKEREFSAWVAGIRQQHRAKRNLMKRMDAAEL